MTKPTIDQVFNHPNCPINSDGSAKKQSNMNCITCNCSVMDKPLYRTNPKGQTNAGWMCLDCMDKDHPELAKNTKEEISDVEKDLHDILYNKPK